MPFKPAAPSPLDERDFQSEGACPEGVMDHIAPRPQLLSPGTDDERVKNRQAPRLFAAAEEPRIKWMVDGAAGKGAVSRYSNRRLPI